MRIAFIFSTKGDAHQIARYRALQDEFKESTLIPLAISRDYYKSDTDIKPVILARFDHGNYLFRLLGYPLVFYRLYINVKSVDIVYINGFDLLLLVYLNKLIIRKKIKLVYEVSDLREIFFQKNFRATIVKFFEAKVIPHIDVIVFTSINFLTDYYDKIRMIEIRNPIIIENKLHLDQVVRPDLKYANSKNDPSIIVIGYFGLLRCPTSLNLLMELANNYSHIRVELRGIFMNNTKSFIHKIENQKNISYFGSYESPDDLKEIYSRVDLVWVAYPFSELETGNHKFARTNRFYEACFFLKPMLSNKDTKDAHRIIEKKIGLALNLKDIKSAVVKISEINKINIDMWTQNLLGLDSSEYQITDEYKSLKRALEN